jgi:hypothetical protein
MFPRDRLIRASIFFGVFWTAFMVWWTGTDAANIVALSIAGAIAATAWYFAMRWIGDRATRRQHGAR